MRPFWPNWATRNQGQLSPPIPTENPAHRGVWYSVRIRVSVRAPTRHAIGKKNCVKQRGQIRIVVMSSGESNIFLKSSYGELSETLPTLSILTTLPPHI